MKIPTLEQFRTNRNVLFWSLHGAGWAAYGITQYFGALLYEKPSSYARVIAVAAGSGFLLSMPMRFIYRRLWGRAPRLMITGVLVTCYIIALALRIVINLSYKQFVEPDWHAQTLFELFGGALSTTYLLLCWSVLYFGIKFYESQRKQEQAMLKAVALAQEAQQKNAALPAQPALPVQHAQCHLDAHPRQPEPQGKPRGDAPVGVPALHPRSGPDEEGHPAPGN